MKCSKTSRKALNTLQTIQTALEPEQVTKANYNRIQPGMSLAEVEAILGKTTMSEEITKSSSQDGTLFWKIDGFRFVVITFENGKVKEKNQVGLD